LKSDKIKLEFFVEKVNSTMNVRRFVNPKTDVYAVFQYFIQNKKNNYHY